MSDAYDWIAAGSGTDRETVKRVLLAYGYSLHPPQPRPEASAPPRGSVVQPWLGSISFRQQAVVLSALRGCDGKPKEDRSKKLTRKFRGAILLPADPTDNANGTFMRQDEVDTLYVRDWCRDLDHYPVHWLMHFAHACQIVSICHPAPDTAQFWGFVYGSIVDALHLNVEEPADMEFRLRDKQ